MQKKNKKAQSKKVVNELLGNPTQENEDPNKQVNGEQEETEDINLETENAALEAENVSLDTENLSMETENVSLETENLSLETEESNHIDNLDEGETLNDSILTAEESVPNGDLINGEHSDTQLNFPFESEVLGRAQNSDSEAVNVSSGRDLNIDSSDQDFVVLFDEKVFLNGEPYATSSPTHKQNCESRISYEGNYVQCVIFCDIYPY